MTSNASPASPLPATYLLSVFGWQKAFFDAWTQAQRKQYESLAVWETSLEAYNKDLWDQWICRFGGGVPLDG